MAYTALDHAGGAGVTTLSGGIANGTDLSFTVVNGTGFPTGGGNGNFYVVVGPTEDLDDPLSTSEKMLCSARSGNTFTVATGGRGADGSTAQAHSSGAKVLHVISATEMSEANDAVVQTIGKVTTAGDLIVGSGAGTFARKAKGTDGQVFAMVSGAPTWAAIPNDSVDSAQIVANAVGASEIATDAVGTAEIAADAVTSSEIAADAVGSSELADNAVDTGAIAADAVTNAKMADDSVDSDQLVDGSIDTAHLGDLQVTTGKLAADAVTGGKLADDSVDSEHYVDGSIDTAHIADLQVTTGKLAAGAVTAAKMADLAANTVLEGPDGGGVPTATGRGRSWAKKLEVDSGSVDTTPTQIAALNIANVALKAGRRYRIDFSGQMSIATGTGVGYVQFRRNSTLFSKQMTPTLSALLTVGVNCCTFYEPGSDETNSWDIYLEAVSANVKIEAAATEEAVFMITDIGLATNS